MNLALMRSYLPGLKSHSSSKSSTSKVKFGGTLQVDEHIIGGNLIVPAFTIRVVQGRYLEAVSSTDPLDGGIPTCASDFGRRVLIGCEN